MSGAEFVSLRPATAVNLHRDYGRRMAIFAMIGSGWRGRMFLDVAHALGTVRCGGVVVRTPRTLDVATYPSLAACLAEVPVDFVLTVTPPAVTPAVVAEVVGRGLPVLVETPPAPDLDGLRALWSAVGGTGLVQVAEQYLMMPSHAARAAVIRGGAIGVPTQVAGVLDTAVPRRLADPRIARGGPYSGLGPLEPVQRSADQPAESPRLDRRPGTPADDHDDRDPRLRRRPLRAVRLHRAADPQPAPLPATHRPRQRR